ncbi:4-aminobutyrate--2-oxoglutarate transaminase [Shewanella algae]|uniref:4-aminobutyrate--2-oxoglutarate transaminase n=1 Tax=Shewanella algae TaxID=38313 RepID=UPI0011821577|nr:4-aminobutyrate--2-oxoglutarate transaminase [Shewanella algae]QHD52199.1 4-aminobutyrate--2-oxoglutarate transaminase [Shewanella algae]TVL00842.1 4-aminobutyrate--2-oxoglutarate transaminase [Shewanella algae]TVL04490.1 4-aminobutyrate--2-oxoglutarate transaminase [Shewanella algae]
MISNDSLMVRRQAAVAPGVGQIHPVFVERAENARVWDVEGREYLDFAGGIAVLNTGHLHPRVKQAVARQLEDFSHTCFMVLGYESYVAVCEKLNALVSGDFAKKSALFTSGSEAVENALKVARAYTKRSGVIAFTSGYHGRTMATLALTGKVAPYSKGMGLMQANVFRAQYPCALHGVSDDDAMKSIEQIFKNDAEPADIAAIILEPVQGEGGFYAASPEFMARLRKLCDKEGIVLIADEVQTGAGRTGTFFAMEQMGVAADITTFAKSIAGGFPLSGITGRAEMMDAIGPGGLGGTYGGNPLACAAALAVIETFEKEQLLARANQVGTVIKEALGKLQQEYDFIADVRGLGAMVAMELVEDGVPKTEYCARVLTLARERGLILLSCGTYGNVLRLLVPLTVSDRDLQQGLEIIAECFRQLRS